MSDSERSPERELLDPFAIPATEPVQQADADTGAPAPARPPPNSVLVPRNSAPVAPTAPARRKRLPKLTPKKSLFVQAILKGCSDAEAARRAGYAKASAKQRGWKLRHHDEAVMAHIEAGLEKIAERTEMDLEGIVAQLQKDRDFAIETKNATAAVRASELLAKIHGHLVERRDVRALGQFRIEIAGIDD